MSSKRLGHPSWAITTKLPRPRELLVEIRGFLEDLDGVESVHDWPGESANRAWLVDVEGRRFFVEVKEI